MFALRVLFYFSLPCARPKRKRIIKYGKNCDCCRCDCELALCVCVCRVSCPAAASTASFGVHGNRLARLNAGPVREYRANSTHCGVCATGELPMRQGVKKKHLYYGEIPML